MPISLKINNRWGYQIAFLMLLISYFLLYFIISKLEEDANSVSHSYAIINNLESIKAEITGAETGARGYVITRDVGSLKPYNAGSRQVLTLYDQLQVLTSHGKQYKVKVDSLGRLIHLKLGYLSDFITGFQRNGNVVSSEMMSSHESNRGVMENIRTLVDGLKEEELTLMNVRNSNLKDFFNTILIMATVSLVITLVTVIYSLITYNRENMAKQKADTNAEAYRKELEARVAELDKAYKELNELRNIEKFAASGRIARTIAHEVRNPLTNISLASEQLKEIYGENEDGEVLLGMIGRSVNRINQLVSDLLTATRMEQLEYAPADINLLLDETLVLAQDRIELNHIKVEKDFNQNLPLLQLDKEKMKLAFLNLIVNAIEAMKNDSGLLQLHTFKQGDECVIEVKDNGAGIDSETMEKLFEPYFTSKMKGNGLGLTHAQNIIINHKGRISVQSKPGQGTKFTVNLKT
jgi:signal transduction histidine kinase